MDELIQRLQNGPADERGLAAAAVCHVLNGSDTFIRNSQWTLPSVQTLRQHIDIVKRDGPTPLSKLLIPPLTRALDDPSLEVRRTAAWSLFRIGPEAALASSRLRRKLATETDPDFLNGAARAVFHIELDTTSALATFSKLLDHEKPLVRQHACYSISLMLELGQPLAKRLSAVATNDPHPDVRSLAAQALALIANTKR